ncbi:MAG TPA: penicillin-binding protein 2 [Steroidobacteraceae bacterium]|nr:penicillin-binding protein 2 [Steroidobacteraceae bacterium]
MSSRVRIKDQWNEQRIFSQRTLGALLVIAVLVVALLARLSYLQVLRHGYYMELSQGNRVRLDPIPASRGLIVDRNGNVLANNEPAYQLELIREQVPNLTDTLKRLVELRLIDPDELEDTRRVIFSRRSFDSVPVRLRLTDDEIGRFAVHRYEFPGVDLATRQTRHYPYGSLGVHALGYVSAISEQDLERIDRASYAGTTLIGKLGVESAFEPQLHGHNGFRQILVNAQGRSVQRQGAYAPVLHSQPPTPGEDLILSIDLTAQEAAEDGLGDHRGAVVAIDPRNGDVLALASKPGFDPAEFARGISRSEYAELSDSIDKPLFNRALRGTYPSGSTIKPVIALAGLTYHLVDPNKPEFCAGVFHLPGSSLLFREGKTGRHGWLDLTHAIAKSCDVYFYGLAATVGAERIAAFMAPFGYGELTGIDISGEKPGLLPSPEWKKKTFKRPEDQVWFPGETVNFGVGQGYLLVTPLQLAHVASVLAERGKSFRPRLVTAVRDVGGQLEPIAPIANPAIQGVSSADWDLVINGMVGAATYGTAAAISKGSSYAIAGKTGTAQVFTVSRSERLTQKVAERLKDHAWFIAFAPVEAPRIAVAVLVENGGFGASAAAPIARKVMDAYLLRQNTAAETATPESEAAD